MIFNWIDAGFIATIKVTTGAGATVTCVQSPYSYSATANSSGVATFTVYTKGNWVVTSTKNGITATSTENMQTAAETRNVALPLRYWIFKAGEGPKINYISHVPGNPSFTYARITSKANFLIDNTTVMADGRLFNKDEATTTITVNLSNYSKFVVDITHHGEATHKIWLLSKSTASATPSDNIIYQFTCPSRTTVSYDISSLTGNKYIGVYNGSSDDATVYNWYLEV